MNNIKVGTTVEGELKLNGDLTSDAGFINSAKVIRTIAPAPGHHADTLITKGYAEEYFIRNNVDDTMTGDLTIDKTTPIITLDSDTGQDGILRFNENGVKEADLYNDSSLHRFRMVLYDGAGAIENEFQLRNDLAWCQGAILTSAIQHPNDNSLTRKDYVDGLNGGNVKTTGNQEIGGIKTFTAGIRADAGLYVDNIAADDNAFIYTNSPFRTSAAAQAAGTNTNDLIWKGYVDNNFTSLTGTQTISGAKTFTGSTLFTQPAYIGTTAGSDKVATIADVNNKLALAGGIMSGSLTISRSGPYLTLNETGTDGNSGIVFNDGGTLDARILNRTLTHDLYLEGGGKSVSLGAGGLVVNTDILTSVPQSSAGNSMVRKDYVDDNDNVVQQTAGYQFVMPTATPTAGQQIQVGSVSGTTVTMVWV